MSQDFRPSGEILPITIVSVSGDANTLKEGNLIEVQGISKGKGFQGVVKRHHFHGHPSSHGHKDQTRMPGSIGSTGPQRVTKGRRMAGRMGGEKVTVKGLKIIRVDAEKNLVFIKGAVPGPANGEIKIKIF